MVTTSSWLLPWDFLFSFRPRKMEGPGSTVHISAWWSGGGAACSCPHWASPCAPQGHLLPFCSKGSITKSTEVRVSVRPSLECPVLDTGLPSSCFYHPILYPFLGVV